MNPRILKKLSQKAEPIIIALGLTKGLERCLSSEHEGDVETCAVVDLKHRTRYPGGRFGDSFEQMPGVVGYGEMLDGYEPEWRDRCCWSILKDFVFESFDEWNCAESEWPDNHCPRKLKRNTAAILKYAREFIQNKERSNADR